MQHIIVIGALPESLLIFRCELIKALVGKGYDLTAMAAPAESRIVSQLGSMGAHFESFTVQRNGLNPAIDFITLFGLRKKFRTLKPNVVLAYTIKPIIWGGLACRVVPKARFYALVTGLGFAFQEGSSGRKLLSSAVSILYRVSLRGSTKVIFQNPDNMQEFISRGIVSADKCVVVNGSGVDIDEFPFTQPQNKKVTFLTIGRLLGEKGFREYAQAARIVKEKYPETVFQLLGPEDSSPDGISIAEVRSWDKKGWIDYLGSASDVREYLKQCNIYVLPSYHEGMPRTVLEAMSIGRPILTTDVPGCRETVISGENGYLVPKADVSELVKRIIWFIENIDQWDRMGKRSREITEEKFDVHKVNDRLLDIMGL